MSSNSKSHVTCFTLLSCLILMASLACSGVSGSSPASLVTHLNSISADKVMLDLYYESLCPASAKFIADQLPRIFDNGLIDITTLQLVPWGNAMITPNNTFDCQHGTYECMLNTIHACAVAFWPSPKRHFPFIHCVEKLVNDGKYRQWQTCFEASALDAKQVLDCYSNGYGKKLELRYAVETASLKPPHQYVPWVVVNGKPLYEDYDNFIRYICKAYKGSLPSACNDMAVDNAPNKAHHIHHPLPPCYTDSSS